MEYPSIIFIIVFVTAIVITTAFPTVVYTGSGCTISSVADIQSDCPNATTKFLRNDPNYNGTHLIVFSGDRVELKCCTPPKKKADGSLDIPTTIFQRGFSYLLHKPGSNIQEWLSVVSNGKVCYDAARDKDVCADYPLLTPIRGYIIPNNTVCQTTTMLFQSITLNETGTWKCSAYDLDDPFDELSAIVEERGTMSCTPTNGTIVGPNMKTSVQCSLAQSSLNNLQFQWKVGTSTASMVSVASNGNYSNSLVTIADLVTNAEQTSSCADFTSVYDKATGSTYSTPCIHYSRNSSLSATVTDLCQSKKDVYFIVTVMQGSLKVNEIQTILSCLLPTTTTTTTAATTTTTVATTTPPTTTKTTLSPSGTTTPPTTTETTLSPSGTTLTSTTASKPSNSTTGTSTSAITTLPTVKTPTTNTPATNSQNATASTLNSTIASNISVSNETINNSTTTNLATLGPGPIAGIVIAAVVVAAIIIIVIVMCSKREGTASGPKIVTTMKNDNQVVVGRLQDASILIVPQNQNSKTLVSNWDNLPKAHPPKEAPPEATPTKAI